MGKKLSHDEQLDTISALREYKEDYSRKEEMLVIAKKGNSIVFNDRVNVIIGDYNIYHRVDIMWDDVNEDYHDLGLFGYYSTTYCKMEYSNRVLTIYDGNGMEIQITK